MEWNKEKIMEAARDFNCWQGDAVIMCDTSDGDVWTDIFCSENDWKEYHSKTIKEVFAKRGILDRNKKISRATLSMLLEKMSI